jgi:hypothetical protein
MSTRIVFNGQEYASREAMPPDVRRTYDELLAKLTADADRDGIPDAFQGQDGHVRGVVKTTVRVNGKEVEQLSDLPQPLQSLAQLALRRVVSEAAARSGLPEPARPADALDSVQRLLRTVRLVIGLFVIAAAVVIGLWLTRHMTLDARSHGNALYVGIGVGVAVVAGLRLMLSGGRGGRP